MDLTPELLAQIQQALASGQLDSRERKDERGRSLIRRDRQLHDLRLLPTADDPRPTFFWSAEQPRGEDVSRTFPYPRLLWTADGIEVTVHGAEEHRRLMSQGYLDADPGTVQVDPLDEILRQFEALPETDRLAILEAQRQDRLGRLQAQMSDLSEEQVKALMAAEPVKRGPGRPRKDVSA